MADSSAPTILAQLVGRWEGEGEGDFPTLDSFTYREQLVVTDLGGDVVQYLQRTWRPGDGGEVRSHVETGFLTARADGTVEILNAQGTDRIEALRGHWSSEGGASTLVVNSVAIAHDDRMVRSWRTITLTEDELSYVMGMATTAVSDGAPHLTATLRRQSRDSSRP